MSALPQPLHPLTVAQYAALGEDDNVRYELQEGMLVMAPRPIPRHMRALARLLQHLEPQLPDGLTVLPEVDVDLELAPRDRPGFVRSPDLVVVDAASYDRVDREGGLLRASDVRLVVEVLSPGSHRTDTRIKRDEYAEARIPHYWIINLGRPISLTACYLAAEFSYVDGGEVTGAFRTTEPFDVRLDLDTLVSA